LYPNQNKPVTNTCEVCGSRFTTGRQDVIDSGLCPDCFIAKNEIKPAIPAKPVNIKSSTLQKILDREQEQSKNYITRSFLRFEDMQLYHLKIISDIREIETKYGHQQCFDVLNIEDNVEYTVLPHKVLREKLKSKQFGVDSEIGVICKGKVEGKTYYDYEVFKWDPNIILDK